MKKSKILISLALAFMLASGFSTVAFAGGGDDSSVPADVPIIPVTEPEKDPPKPLTPEGNLTLVDDVTTDDEQDKQFITAVSKNGNYFYLVIDRAGDKDNVYLLNLIDEADLMALMEGEKVTIKPAPEPIPTPEEKLEPVEPEKPVEQPKNNTLPLLALLIALGGGGAFYYLKFIKDKKIGGGKSDLNNLGDDDDYDDGPEYDTADAFGDDDSASDEDDE